MNKIIGLAFTVAVLGIAGLCHEYIFRQAARFWVVSDPVDHADAVVVLGGGLDVRPQAAAELFRNGTASEVLVPRSQYDGGREARLMCDVLVRAGVPLTSITEFQIDQHSTYGEAIATAKLASKRGFKALLIPTDLFPTRRTLWIFRRALGPNTVVGILPLKPPHYSAEDWWRHDAGVRSFLSEIVKYVYYRAVY
jgi:uncharacterized SAM-binding protein YcdF (DUF218 family)